MLRLHANPAGLRPGLLAAALGLAALPAGAQQAFGAAKPSLSASNSTIPGISLTATVRSGPYFANEALAVALTLRNTSKRTLQVTQPPVCRFSAALLLPGGKVAGSPLPPPPSCGGPSSPRQLKPGESLSGSALVAIPAVSGKAGQTVSARLRASVLVTLGGVSTVNPTVVGASVAIPVLVSGKPSPVRPEQTLHVAIVRIGQGFQLKATDGRNKPVAGARGWYILTAPDGPLAWGVASPGVTTCATGCLQGGAVKPKYQLQVVMAQDGYTVARTTLAYK